MNRRKFENLVIVSDIDGTFLGKGGKTIPRNVEAISYFKENGGLFSFATGRVEFTLQELIPNYREIVNAPGILCNGCYLYDFEQDKKITERSLDAAYVKEVLKMVHRKFPEIGIRISHEKGFFTPKVNEFIYRELRSYFDRVTELPFDSMPLDTPWYKVVLGGASETLEKIRTLLLTECGDKLAYTKSCASLLEIMDYTATKGEMLLSLKDHYRRYGENKTIYAVGDYENDLDMLRKADISVCPSNSLQSVLDACDVVVCSNEEGAIAGLIEHITKRS